jgi:hypothetical protein
MMEMEAFIKGRCLHKSHFSRFANGTKMVPLAGSWQLGNQASIGFPVLLDPDAHQNLVLVL